LFKKYSNFSLPLAYNLQFPPANGKQARVAEEIYETLLSNRKPEHNDKLRAAHIEANFVLHLPEEIH
jgi:hypothetical protein